MQIVIDCETLGTDPGCIVTEIGWAKVRPSFPIDGFFWAEPGGLWRPSFSTQVAKGMTAREDTIRFREKTTVRLGEQRIEHIATELYNLCRDASKIWFRGPSFDVPIIDEMFQRTCGYRVLGKYFRQFRDIRTIMDAGLKTYGPREHTADSDAMQDAYLVVQWEDYLARMEANANDTRPRPDDHLVRLVLIKSKNFRSLKRMRHVK